MEESLKVSRKPDGRPEIFHSLQGEGANIGKPAVFLRLGLCNLACQWCDTKHTWDWELYDPNEQIVELSPEEIEREILKYNSKYLVVTGGEPMIQQRRLIPLIDRLKGVGFYIEVETNGTIVPRSALVNLIDHWSVSPKLENSGNSPSERERPEAYRFFSDLPSCYFKYVLQKEGDLLEVQQMMHKYDIARDRVALMPEAKDVATLLERGVWLAELCKEQGYMYSTRLQVLSGMA